MIHCESLKPMTINHRPPHKGTPADHVFINCAKYSIHEAVSMLLKDFCECQKIAPEVLTGPSRLMGVVRLRNVFIYLCVNQLRAKLVYTAEILNRTHSTISYTYKSTITALDLKYDEYYILKAFYSAHPEYASTQFIDPKPVKILNPYVYAGLDKESQKEYFELINKK